MSARRRAAALAITLIAAPLLGDGAEHNANIIREARGAYVYLTQSTQAERGDERWHLTVHPDGSRTLRMYTRIQDLALVRDVILRVDADFRPLEMTMTTWADGVRTGTGLFTVSGNEIVADVMSPNGRLGQTVMVPDGFSFVPHSVSGDGWHFWPYDRRAGGVQTLTVYNPSTRGEERGSILGLVHDTEMEFIAAETIQTPAGEFATDHFLLDERYDIWITGADRIMVRFIDRPVDREYLLVEYEQSSD